MAYSKKQIQEAKELIIERLSYGDSLKSILKANNTLPSRPIVYQWLNEEHKDYDKEFLNNYIQAREDSADLDAENIEEIAHKTLEGEYEPPAARVAIDAFKWTAGRKKPKKYGDKIDITSGGDKIKSPVYQVREVIVDKSDESN